LHIPVREQRNLPYIFIIVSNIIGFIFISWLSGTGVLAGALLANALGGIIVTFINLYWKISAHAFGVTAPLSILVLLFGWIMWPFALLVPVVGWARVYLHAHTLGQIVAGFLLGFALTYLQFVFIFQPLGWFK
jgi:membrane-associated phospholipid phosphatase